MPEPLRTDDPAVDAVIVAYLLSMRRLAALALAGEINERLYIRRQIILAQNNIRAAFLLAGGDVTNPQAAAWLREQYRIASESARKLASDVFDGRYSSITVDGEVTQTAADGLAKLDGRLTLWTFVIGQANHRGIIYQPAWLPDINGTWHVGDTEHCSTCLAQDNVTLPRSGWMALAARGIEPQGRGLECGGWKCQCRIDWEK